MISHKYKCIFIHIPKTAGSSINEFYFSNEQLDWKKPNYELLYGWCPKRKIHLQHATTKQLLETELISINDWENYFKFTFVRNPWDRAYSGYLWFMKDRNLKISFKDYINQNARASELLIETDNKNNRGVHLLNQTDFFEIQGEFKLDFVGRFENLCNDLEKINNVLGIENSNLKHEKRSSNRFKHYSIYYKDSYENLIRHKYQKDIELLDYKFEDERNLFQRIRKLI